MLSIYEAKNNDFLSWDEANAKINEYGWSYSLDHIMVQTPEMNDSNLKYYKLDNLLILKEGHDFPNSIYDRMDYEEFESHSLHQIGNLRLKGGDANSSRGNESFANFNSYKNIRDRSIEISTFFIENVLRLETPSRTIVSHKSKKVTKQISGYFDLTNDFNLTNVSFKGKKIVLNICGKSFNIKRQIEIFISIVSYLTTLDEEKMINLAKSNYSPKKRVIISDNKNSLFSYAEIKKNCIYLEKNLSSNDVIKYSILFLNEFGIPRNKVSIYIPED